MFFQINDVLDLGISKDKINFANVQRALNGKTKKIDYCLHRIWLDNREIGTMC
jgi:predicted RNA-binding protein